MTKEQVQREVEGMSVDEFNDWLRHARSSKIVALYDGSLARAQQAVNHAFHRAHVSKTEKPNQSVEVRVVAGSPAPKGPLPSGSSERKAVPMVTGVLDYFPAALAEVAKVSKAGNDKHNPGEALHHSRGKSTDHADSLVRHVMERGGIDPDTGQRHSAEAAWRALAMLQQELEDEGLVPMARGARVAPNPPQYDRNPPRPLGDPESAYYGSHSG